MYLMCTNRVTYDIILYFYKDDLGYIHALDMFRQGDPRHTITFDISWEAG